MLDVDGTLAPIAPRPEDAVVPEETQRILAALAARPATHVVIVSGRSAADARRMLPTTPAWFLGNHGIETVSPDGAVTVDPVVTAHRPAMARAVQAISAGAAAMAGVLVEDKQWTLTVHYRLAGDGVLPALQRLVDGVARSESLRTVAAKMAIEVRPPVAVDKGTAVVALAERLGALAPGAALLFAGDDVTDEDAFRALRDRSADAVTLRVVDGGGQGGGSPDRPTRAEFCVSDPAALQRILDAIARMPG
ncbi:MAG: hypothetical protein NVS1B4_24310 [Gemmatimonadaceae bacterium]